jgi:BirA family biotin operon repressor/biotin-[acetyl-CoA-carboxylase] ligase
LNLIKLDAIDSTNSFLKELVQNSSVEDYTVVSAKKQTSGRGQMNNTWVSEPHKNLTFSIFTRFKHLNIEHQPYLGFAVAIAIFEVLNTMAVPNLSIKWPNDIMSGNKKICGILVETTFTQQKIKNTIIGIGLNVNQKEFPTQLSHASSLLNLLGKEFDLDSLMVSLTQTIRQKIDALEHHQFESIHQKYLDHLYKKDVPTTFKNEKTQLFFMGMIKEVSTSGNLRIQLEDDSIVVFGIKEISMARA